jgi:hypothetical protein
MMAHKRSSFVAFIILTGEHMPLISEFFGIKIYMYWDEHVPPHFHAQYANEDVLVSKNQWKNFKD